MAGGQRGSNHVNTGVAGGQRGSNGGQRGQIMLTRESLGQRGPNHVDTGVAGGQRGSKHVVAGVSGGQIMLTRGWLGGVKSC